MATSLAPEKRHQHWAEPDAEIGGDHSARALWLWTLFGALLLIAFLAFVVDDFPLRTLTAAR